MRMSQITPLILATSTVLSACSASPGDGESVEDLGTTSEALAKATERSDVTVYTQEAPATPPSGGYFTCPAGKVLVGIDQFDGTNSIACKSDSGILWDYTGVTTTNENISSNTFNGWDVPAKPLPASNSKIIGFFSIYNWVPIGVNCVKGTLKARLAQGGGPPASSNLYRSHSWEVLHYQLNGGTQEIHACPSTYPYMHGAVVKLSGYPSHIQNVSPSLALGDISCVQQYSF